MFALFKIFQASLSLPGSPFNLRRGSRGSHQFTIRNGRGRFVGPPGGDRKPLVLSTYLDAQVSSFICISGKPLCRVCGSEKLHCPIMTFMNEENGTIKNPFLILF